MEKHNLMPRALRKSIVLDHYYHIRYHNFCL